MLPNNIDSLVRIQFYSLKRAANEQITTTWHDAVYCHDLYINNTNYNLMNNEFNGLFNYVCPNITEISIDNDPFSMSGYNGTSFGMVVHDCSVAV